ncbi:MAG: ribosome maturation factor RimM [Luteitalea sp.]|nr:ribosome maturation factor RimM [Luteitalea sp.]
MTSDWDEMVVVGTIARPHGIRGEVAIDPQTDFPDERFRRGAQLFVKRAGQVERLTVRGCRAHQRRVLVLFEGVATRTAAEALGRAELRVPASTLQSLPPDTYYQHDLVGCRVRLASGELVGEVVGYDAGPEAGRLVVRSARGELLIPLVRSICVSVDTGAKDILVDPPEGLLDL